jgi:deoxycytidylate deaminase
MSDQNAENRQQFTLDYPDAELVLGIVCAVGTDYRPVVDYLSNLLKRARYRVREHSISKFFPEITKKLGIEMDFPEGSEYHRIDSRMRAGNAIRKTTEDPGFMAVDIASRIYSTRGGVDVGEPEALPSTAHILVSLKRVEEAEILRRIYGPGFYLIGIFSSEEERRDYLETEKGIYGKDLDALISRDQKEADEFGQRTRDTFEHADVFVALKDRQFKSGIKKFVHLIFGFPYATPTKDEYGMFFACSASARSGALGRQVGAAILSPEGDLLAVGCNDVPSPAGGLYWEEDGANDHRDYKRGEDSNDIYKDKIIDQAVIKFEELESTEGRSSDATAIVAVRKAVTSAISDITEYGRCVHAEMDAITTCARKGIAIAGSILYTTTFPCHNCTRHVVAAGIKRVVYIEPYPKSQAGSLHGDAICLGDEANDGRKIPFVPFVGIGPLRFFDLFSLRLGDGYRIERKKDKEIIEWKLETDAKPRVPMPPTSYLQREELISQKIVLTYQRKSQEDHNGESGARSQDGRGILGSNEEDSRPSRKMAGMEDRRKLEQGDRTGTSDNRSGGPLFES